MPIARPHLRSAGRSFRVALCTVVVVLGGVHPATGASPAPPAGPAPTPPAPPAEVRPPTTPVRPERLADVEPLPPVRLDPPMKDFGFVRPLTENRFTFKLWNESDSPLEIAAVTPSCKCTTTNDLAGTVIAPGEYAELGAQLDAGAAIGPKAASVKLLIDGYTRVLTVSLRAEVTQILRIVPGYINAVGGENEQGRLVIESTDGRPFRICSVHGLPVMEVGASDGEPKTRHLIAYDLTAFEPGTIPRYLVIETDHPDCPAADVLVRHDTVKLIGGVRGVQEMRGSFGRIEPGESAIMSVRFKETDRPIEFVSISAESPDVTLELLDPERDPETGIMEARFKLTPRDGFTGLVATRVLLHTADRKQEFLAYGRVAPTGACIDCDE